MERVNYIVNNGFFFFFLESGVYYISVWNILIEGVLNFTRAL